MKTQTITVISQYDGLKLSVLLTRPDGEVKGLVQIAHGMAEYKERYLPFMEALAQQGYAALINDHRGHGDTASDRNDYGWFGRNGAQALVEDLHQLTGEFKARFPGLPLCLFGHSMGSLAVRAYAHAYAADIDSLVVCGCPSENPAGGMGLAIVRLLEKIKGPRSRSAFVDNLVNGSFVKRFREEGSRFAWINSDKEKVKAYENDEKCGFMFTLNGYEALLDLMKMCYSPSGWKVSDPGTPVLFISGGDDPCMLSLEKLHSAADSIRRAGYRNVRINVYEKMRHEILQEPRRGEVIRDIIEFLKQAD